MQAKEFNFIYKKTKTGAIQVWKAEVDGGKYRVISGQKDGKHVVSEWTRCEPTNVGRANERNAEQQALFEVEAQYKKKLEKDYHKNIDDVVGGAKIFEGMLAEVYKDRLAKKISNTFPNFKYDGIYSQPKLNGMRCFATKDGLWTRNGKRIVSCPHIEKALEPVFQRYTHLVLDGELYNHDYKDDFNELMSIFKQTKPTKEDLDKSERLGQYHLYDVTVSDDSEYVIEHNSINESKTITPSTNFYDRYNFLVELINQEMLFGNVRDTLKLTRTDIITSKEKLDALYEYYIKDGYEGQMIRLNTPYENRRTWNLLKRKDFYDAEYELVDILEGKGNWSGKAKRAILKLPNSETFGAGITGTMEFCSDLLKNKHKYIGKMTTVNYQILTPDGKPLFGRCTEFDRMDV